MLTFEDFQKMAEAELEALGLEEFFGGIEVERVGKEKSFDGKSVQFDFRLRLKTETSFSTTEGEIAKEYDGGERSGVSLRFQLVKPRVHDAVIDLIEDLAVSLSRLCAALKIDPKGYVLSAEMVEEIYGRKGEKGDEGEKD